MSQAQDYKLISSDPDAVAILSKLLNNPDKFTSGSELSSILGVSRPAVWAKLEKLRDQGFEVEALRNRGYRILEQPLHHNAQLLEYATLTKGCAIPCLYFPEIDSTNSEAERQISYGRQAPFAVVSSSQTKGTGRQGRAWFSASKKTATYPSPSNPTYLPENYKPLLSGQAFIFVGRCRNRSLRQGCKSNGRMTFFVRDANLQAC